jgi:hypothetical protein
VSVSPLFCEGGERPDRPEPGGAVADSSLEATRCSVDTDLSGRVVPAVLRLGPV